MDGKLEPVPQRAQRQHSTVSIHSHPDSDRGGEEGRTRQHTFSSSNKVKRGRGNSFRTEKVVGLSGVLDNVEKEKELARSASANKPLQSFSPLGGTERRSSIAASSEGGDSSLKPGGMKSPSSLPVPGEGSGSGGLFSGNAKLISTNSTVAGAKWNFEKSNITLDDLKQLKEVFDRAAEQSDGKLSEPEFLDAFAPILAGSMTPEQLSLWFTHIDASDDNSVEWEEFSMFLLLAGGESNGGEEGGDSSGPAFNEENQVFVKDPKTLTVPPTESSATSVSGYNHSEIITSSVAHPRLNKYYTGSQDGTVRVWEAGSLEFQQVMHNTKAWVTSICLGRHDSKLCVSSVDRVVSVYDVHSEKLAKAFVGNTTAVSKYTVAKHRQITREEIDFRNMSYARSRRAGKGFSDRQEKNFQEQQEKLRLMKQLGQGSMDMHILSEMDYPAMCMLSPDNMSDCVFLGLSSGVVQGYRLLGSQTPDVLEPIFNTEKFARSSLGGGGAHYDTGIWEPSERNKMKLHKGPITTMQATNKPDHFITTGSDGMIRMVNIEKNKVHTIGEKYMEDKYFKTLSGSRHAPPIHSSAWVTSLRLLATSGTERNVSLWSPNSNGPPIPLKGHLASVAHVCNVDDENYLVSIDTDKCIKVWDLRTLRSVQTTVDYDVYRPNNKITSLTYDTKRKQLVTGCAAPVVWPLSKVLVAFPDPKYKGHQRSVISVCFNPRFHKIVTADADCVRLWSVETGELQTVWTVESLRSTAVKSHEEGEPQYIFEMIFAANYKRLIIGLSSGSVFIINFASGQLITEMLPMKPGVNRREISFAECTDLEHFNSAGQMCVGCLRGSEILVWKDGENADEKRLDYTIRINLDLHTYNAMKWVQEEEVIHNWRSPLPLCICGMGETHFLVGTDSAIILVYNSMTWELVSIFGQYEPAANIMCIAYNEKKDIVISGRSDGKISVNSFNFKDRTGSIVLRDSRSRSPILQTIDIGEMGELIVAGDEEGYVYVCNIASFAIADLPPFRQVTATLEEPAGGLECICYFQAHNTEILRVQLFHWNGSRYIATCASDCQSRIFSVEGEFIGYCGEDSAWDLIRPRPANYMRKIPAPVVPDHWSSIRMSHFVPHARASVVGALDQVGTTVDSSPGTPLQQGLVPSLTAASFLPEASTFNVNTMLNANQQATPLSSHHGSPLSSTVGPGKSINPGASAISHGNPLTRSQVGVDRTLAGRLSSTTAPAPAATRFVSPPKSRSQLIKQSPRFANPTRGDAIVSGGAAPLRPPAESVFSQNKGKTIEHQKVRLTRHSSPLTRDRTKNPWSVEGGAGVEGGEVSVSQIGGQSYHHTSGPSSVNFKLPAIAVASNSGSSREVFSGGVKSARGGGSVRTPRVPTMNVAMGASNSSALKDGPLSARVLSTQERNSLNSAVPTLPSLIKGSSIKVTPGLSINIDGEKRNVKSDLGRDPTGADTVSKETSLGYKHKNNMDASNLGNVMLEGRGGLFVYRDFQEVAHDFQKKQEEKLKEKQEALNREASGAISNEERPSTPIDTKMEMWKSGKAQRVENEAGQATLFTRLDLRRDCVPDDEAKSDILTKKHKMPTQLLLENDTLLKEMKIRPAGHGHSSTHQGHAGTIPTTGGRGLRAGRK